MLGLALPARAASNVTVGCAGASGTFNFTTLNAALGAISGTNDTITVSGTCTEFVMVDGVRRLTIIGTTGATLVDPGGDTCPPPPPASPSSCFDGVLTIANSQGVVVLGLMIQVASRPIDFQIPVVSVEGSTATFSNCKLEGAGPSDGIDIGGPSSVTVRGTTVIENNNDGQGNGEGIRVFGGSSLFVGNNAPANCPVIQGNGDNGIRVEGGGSAVVRRCATIQNNGVVGILALGGSIVIDEPQAMPGAIRIQGNAFGVLANNGGRLSIGGPALIQGNTSDGVRLRAAAGTIFATDPGPAGPTIQQNGSGPFICCALFAGISVAQDSQLDLNAGLVTSNFAPGLLVQDDSSVRIFGDLGSTLRITNNPVGVVVTNLSTAALFLGPIISGNTGPDLSCSPDSVAYGDVSGVGRINCPGFKVQPVPGAPIPPPKSPL